PPTTNTADVTRQRPTASRTAQCRTGHQRHLHHQLTRSTIQLDGSHLPRCRQAQNLGVQIDVSHPREATLPTRHGEAPEKQSLAHHREAPSAPWERRVAEEAGGERRACSSAWMREFAPAAEFGAT